MECEFPKENASNPEIDTILDTYKTIAVVGLSDKPDRPSYGVSEYMKAQGYRIIPVNPAAEAILGETSYPSVAAIPAAENVEIVNIFRKPDAVPAIVDEAIARGAKVVWMQDGIVHNAAADKARAAGLKVVMSKCLYREHRRRHG